MTDESKKSEYINVRVTGPQKAIVQENADDKGLSLSAYFRSLLYEKIPALRKLRG